MGNVSLKVLEKSLKFFLKKAYEPCGGNHLVSSMGVTYIYMYLNNSCMLLLTLNQYWCKCFKITSEQWVKGSNQFNKIKHLSFHLKSFLRGFPNSTGVKLNPWLSHCIKIRALGNVLKMADAQYRCPLHCGLLEALTQTPGNLHLIMKKAPHIMTKAPRIMMTNKGPHIM